MMSLRSKVCKNLAEEDRKQKALKKEKKAVKKWKWTTEHNEQSFKKDDQLVQAFFKKDEKHICATLAAQGESFFYFSKKIRFQLIPAAQSEGFFYNM